MFSRKKSSDVASAVDPVTAAAEIEQPGSKGRPTPKRKVSEAANKRPLVPDDRRAAAKAARSKQRESRDLEYQAMKSGDEKNLPPRDRGQLRRYIRNYVDARRNVAEYFLFIAAAFLVLTFVSSKAPGLAVLAILAVYVVVLVAIVDSAIMWRMLKKRLVAKFGADAVVRGTMMYAVMRAFQIRRARLPKPMVKHGEYPS
ncbi:Protein of unknown function [Sanguibacter gelidistatuariae]|uniref:DUF3043 domain-containing protein n=1 Tax=Sanguibacter gelidistatuariae TaxID=1814289 RepID=A0A1G6R9C3_9MICO|nr:DUF3043 domain-containing protein [Sanguibacter gelidistatuariae]SDD01209.1 Protein of unknown function [Sanguibacter gelidistatuariae]